MKNRILEKRDKSLLAAANAMATVFFSFSIAVFLIGMIMDFKKQVAFVMVSYVVIIAWLTICDYKPYCREASLMILSAVFFFIGCLIQAPLWILVRGFYGAWELFICRLRRFIKLESYRFKKHSL